VIKVKNFLNFVREQGVVGLAVGFILGGAVSKVVTSLVTDIINPVIGIFLGRIGNLGAASVMIGSAELRYGSFISVIIDFLIVAAVVYFGVKGLKLESVDKKK
jgi:large conductance mechanosensitive channel